MKVRQERGRSISLSALSEQRRRSSVGEVRIPSPLLLRKKTLEGDFDVRFFEFLVSMGVEGEARERLAAMPMEQKRAWLELHQKSKRASGQLALSRAQQYAAQLAAGEGDEALLTALRVCVQTEPVEWMEEFAAAGGAAAVLSQLSAAEKQERGGPAEEMARQARLLQLLHVVAAMLLTKRGRQILLLDNKASVPILSLCQLINCSLQDTLQRLALCLDPRTVGPAARALLYDRLALLCNHEPQFFPAVAAALEYYAFAKRERARHLDLLRAVRDEPAPAVRTSALRLVNVLVSTPDDLDERLRTRRAFLALGLAGALQRAPPALAAHQPFAIETDIFFKGKLSSVCGFLASFSTLSPVSEPCNCFCVFFSSAPAPGHARGRAAVCGAAAGRCRRPPRGRHGPARRLCGNGRHGGRLSAAHCRPPARGGPAARPARSPRPSGNAGRHAGSSGNRSSRSAGAGDAAAGAGCARGGRGHAL